MTLAALATTVERYTRNPKPFATSAATIVNVPGLHFLRKTEATDFESSVYEPVVCLILQGTKETTISGRRYHVDRGKCIVVSHDLPVMSRITEADPKRPYLALVAQLELSELRRLHDEVDQAEPVAEPTAYAVGPIRNDLLDVMTRYVALAEDPVGARVLTPLVRKELYFRLLMSSQGAMLRTLLHRESHASNIARAIQRLRTEFRSTVEVAALARFAGMSTSSFHKHFKQVTATTPLQFQKDLRLTEARRLLRAGDHSVSSAAFEVGYESATQFSREYSRKFGAPPSQHLRDLQSQLPRDSHTGYVAAPRRT